MLLETHLGHKSLKWPRIERLAGIQDCQPHLSLSGYMCFSFTRQSTSEHFPLRTSDVLSFSPSTTFEKCEKITFAALE